MREDVDVDDDNDEVVMMTMIALMTSHTWDVVL